MPNITVQHNAACLKCGCVEKEMVRIGAFTMCNKCAREEFDCEEFYFNKDSLQYATYLEWLNVYKALL